MCKGPEATACWKWLEDKMRPACPEQRVTKCQQETAVWEVPRNSAGHGEELDFIQRALGSQGRVLRWEVTSLLFGL